MAQITQSDILKTIADALDVDEGSITINSKAEEITGWDSMGHLGILVALDELFDGKISSIEEIASATSVKEIVELLKQNNLI